MTEFSIIVPTYNNASSITRTVESVLRQKFQNWELIIVDDGSSDNTEDVIRQITEEDERVQYQRQENQGVAAARNNGAKSAKGKYVIFLDSDDTVADRWLQDFHDLQVSRDAGYFSCGYQLYGKNYAPRIIEGVSSKKYSSLAGTFALQKKVFEEIKGFDSNLKQSENFEMTARALEFCEKKNLQILYTDSANFIWQHEKSSEQTRKRDEHRARATLYLHKKYSDGGVFHYKKDDFIISSAVNFTRAGKFKEARQIFYRIFKEKPSVSNFLRIIVFETPFLRRKKWMRKAAEN